MFIIQWAQIPHPQLSVDHVNVRGHQICICTVQKQGLFIYVNSYPENTGYDTKTETITFTARSPGGFWNFYNLLPLKEKVNKIVYSSLKFIVNYNYTAYKLHILRFKEILQVTSYLLHSNKSICYKRIRE